MCRESAAVICLAGEGAISWPDTIPCRLPSARNRGAAGEGRSRTRCAMLSSCAESRRMAGDEWRGKGRGVERAWSLL